MGKPRLSQVVTQREWNWQLVMRRQLSHSLWNNPVALLFIQVGHLLYNMNPIWGKGWQTTLLGGRPHVWDSSHDSSVSNASDTHADLGPSRPISPHFSAWGIHPLALLSSQGCAAAPVCLSWPPQILNPGSLHLRYEECLWVLGSLKQPWWPLPLRNSHSGPATVMWFRDWPTLQVFK